MTVFLLWTRQCFRKGHHRQVLPGDRSLELFLINRQFVIISVFKHPIHDLSRHQTVNVLNSLFSVHSIECQGASFYIIKIGSTSRTTLTSRRLIIALFSSHKLWRNRWSALTSKPFKRICHLYFFAILKSGASTGPNISRDLDNDLFFFFNVLQRSPTVWACCRVFSLFFPDILIWTTLENGG